MLDFVQSFQIDPGLVRGRLVRLGPVIDQIMTAHDYPMGVARLLAETMAVGATLAAALKYEGILTIQAQGDGAVSLLVVDVTSDGAIRGYARFSESIRNDPKINNAGISLVGKGYLAFTIDQGAHTDRYQGIVELAGDTLAEAVNNYFQNSEQLDTDFRIFSKHTDAGWQAGAMMIQRMPAESKGVPILTTEESIEHWQRACILINTLTEQEALSAELSSEQLLFRLFHEDGVHAFEPRSLRAECRCSRERVGNVLYTLPQADRDELLHEDGKIEISCEFCSALYVYKTNDFAHVGE